jgi:nitroreductase/predicted Zn-ribbon and HTH transcriptional regulator
MGTRRQEIIAILSARHSTVRQLAEQLQTQIAVIVDDLAHIQRSVGKRLVVGTARCLECGFTMKRERRFTAPSRCPRCRSEQTSEPELAVLEEPGSETAGAVAKEPLMETMQAILTRRSIRRFTAEPVSAADLETLLRAAMSAPSANDERPWHFVVLDDRELLDAVPRFHPYAQMLREAPLAILVCADRRLEQSPGYWVQDCSAATQNLLLAAHARGLGAVWLGVHPRPEREAGARELLKLPEPILPLALVAVGHPAERKLPEDRFSTERVHRNGW